jgi:hypothetical protein
VRNHFSQNEFEEYRAKSGIGNLRLSRKSAAKIGATTYIKMGSSSPLLTPRFHHIIPHASNELKGERIMSRFTHKLTLALLLVVFVASTALTATNTVTAPDDQVSFTVEGTAVITSVTKLLGGITQLDGTTTGKATHLGDVTGPVTRHRHATSGNSCQIPGKWM